MLIFGYSEQGRPSREVMHVEVDVVILRERVKICQIHSEQVLWLKSAQGSHGGNGVWTTRYHFMPMRRPVGNENGNEKPQPAEFELHITLPTYLL